MKGIRAKILLATMPWLGAFCLVAVIFGPLQMKRALNETTAAKALNLARASAENITAPLYFQDESSLKEAIQRIWESEDIAYVVVQDAAGKILQSSGQGTADWAGYRETDGNPLTPDERIFRTGLSVQYKDATIGRLYLGFKNEFVAFETAKARTNIMILGMIFFLLGTIVVIVMSGWMTRPIQTISAAARQIAEGDLTRRVEIRSRDEAGELARSFNKMVDRLQELYQSLETQVANRTGELRREIEERKKAEDLIRENEQLLRSMLEGLGEGVGIVDQDEVFQATNPAAEEIYGVGPGGLVGRNVKEFLSAEGASMVDYQTQHRQKGIKGVYDLEIIAAGGERKMLLITAMPRFDREGKHNGTLAVFADITQRKKVEDQIRDANEKLRRSVQELERRNTELGLLSEMGESFPSCQSEAEIYTVGARFGEKLFPLQSGAFLLAQADGDLLELRSSWGRKRPAPAAMDVADCWGLRRGKIYIMENPGKDLVCGHLIQAGLTSGRSICVPMMSFGDLRGVLTISYDHSDHPEQEELRPLLATNLTEYLGTAVVNLRLRDSLREKSIRDPLTGLYNRRFMEETLDREIRRAIRMKVSVGLIMVDIDRFKSFNDTYGHDAGDLMLCEVSRLLLNHVRREDVVCRYGGEEFLLILPGAAPDLVRARAVRLGADAQSLTVPYRDVALGPVTLSMGCGSFPEDGEDRASAVKAADNRLLQAKKDGRNKVVG
jgi:diguanylate cyclase (GGDEF)-like protein/PAS domain S-box-containing protein